MKVRTDVARGFIVFKEQNSTRLVHLHCDAIADRSLVRQPEMYMMSIREQ